MANAEVPGFNINSSGLRLIRRRYREGRTSTKSRIPGLKEFLHAEKDAEVAEPPTTVGAETSRPSSPHETQAEVDEALDNTMFPSPSRVNEYGSNIPFAAGAEDTTGAASESKVSRNFVPATEPSDPPPREPLESHVSPRRPVETMPEKTISAPGSAEGRAEESGVLVPTARGSKRPGPPRTKRVVKRGRQGALIESVVSSSTTAEGAPDTAEGAPIHTEVPVAAAVVSELGTGTQNDDTMIPAVIVPDTSLALTIVTTPSIEIPPVPTSVCQSESSPSTATPSSFDLSKEYGVSLIRNNFLTILRGSPTQVLERGGDFAGIKAVLEPLLSVMESLTNATATLPYRTHLLQVEALFNKWQSRRDQPLHSMIEDRAMQLIRQRDDSQFELQRQILEKKQAVHQLGETTTALFNESKRVADIERNQQLLVDSYKAALLDLQTKLAEAESELRAATERHQTLEAQWTEHQAIVQAESDELEKLSVAVSQMPVLSDDELHKQAAEEVKIAHREAMVTLAAEIRQAVEHL